MKKRSRFTVRLVYSYAAVFAALMLLFLSLAYYYIARTGRELAILNQNEFAGKTLAQVEGYLSDLEDISYRIMTNPKLLNLFNHLQTEPETGNFFDTNILLNIDTGSLLGTINGPNSKVWRIGVYNQLGDYIRTGAMEDKVRRNNILASSNVEESMFTLRDLPDKMEILPAAVDRWSDIYSSQFVTVKRPLMNIYSQEVYGVVEIQQDISRLQALMQFDTLTAINISVRDRHGTEILRVINGGEIENGFRVSRTSDKYGWTVTLTQSQERMLAPYQPLINVVTVGGSLLIVLVTVVITMIAARLSRPLVALKDAVSDISYGKISVPLGEGDSIDEVRELSLAFNSMLGRISDSVELEKKAMLLAMQSQMNPHFLYNVITVIDVAGMEGKREQVSKMCGNLCSMLRYVSSFEDVSVTLRDEAENVTTYLELMKARYEDYFSYRLDISPDLLALPLPKLVLQPLAENCFEHAFSGMEPPYEISLVAGVAADGWYIRISDNGCGFSPAQKAEVTEKVLRYSQNLEEHYSQMKLGGLGLINTALRLRFNGVKPIALLIGENKPHGTTMTLKGELP